MEGLGPDQRSAGDTVQASNLPTDAGAEPNGRRVRLILLHVHSSDTQTPSQAVAPCPPQARPVALGQTVWCAAARGTP